MKFHFNYNKKMDSPDEKYFQKMLDSMDTYNGEQIIWKNGQTLVVELLEAFVFHGKKESRTLYYPDFVVETATSIYFIEIKGIMKALNGLKYKMLRKKLIEFEEQTGKKIHFDMLKYIKKVKTDFEAFVDYGEFSKATREAKKLNKYKELELKRPLALSEKVINWHITERIFERKLSGGKWKQNIMM